MVDGDAELKSSLSKSAKRRLRQRRAIERVQAPIDRSRILLMRAADLSKSPCQSWESRLNTLEFLVQDIHWCLIGQHQVVNHASSTMEPTVEIQKPLFNPDAPEFWPTQVDSGVCSPGVGLTAEEASAAPESDVEVEKSVDDKSADASKKIAEPAESFKTETISADDRVKKQLFRLCAWPDGTLDPCKALELVMGRPKPSGHQREVEVAKPPKVTNAAVEQSVLPTTHEPAQDMVGKAHCEHIAAPNEKVPEVNDRIVSVGMPRGTIIDADTVGEYLSNFGTHSWEDPVMLDGQMAWVFRFDLAQDAATLLSRTSHSIKVKKKNVELMIELI